VVITDALPLDFSYVSSRASPTLPLPTVTGGITCVWTVGELAPRATGFITVVARPNAALPWPSTPAARTNVVLISSLIYDGAAGNDSWGEPVDVVPNPAATITVTAYPTAIPADGSSTAVITAEVRDMYSNPVLDGTAITFTTNLPGTVFQPGGTQTHLGTTTGGVATTILRAGTVAGRTTITVKVGALQRTGEVQLLALEPYTVTISANPWAIPVSRGNEFSTLRITVTDQYRNLVHGAAVTLTTDAGALQIPGVVTGTEIVLTTTNGVATARLTSTESVMTATVTAAITTTGRPTASAQVYFMAALPYTITLDVYPTALVVCGQEAMITATIQDELGNPVENGTAVYFDAIPATAGELRYRSVLTVNGVATSTVVTKAYHPVPSSLEVSVSAGRISRHFLIDLVAGPPAEVSFRMSPSAVPACGGVAEVEALVTDCAGNRVKNGTAITFSVGSLATLVPDTTSTSNGLAYTVVRSGSLAGSTVLSAAVGSIVRTFVVVIDPGPADVIYMDLSPATISNCGGGRAVVTATLRDACNNLVKDGTMVTFGPTYGYVSLSRYNGPTTNGVLTTTAIANQRKPIAPVDWPLALEQIYAYSGAALQAFRNLWIRPGVPSQVGVSVDPEQIRILGDVNGYDIMVVADVMDCSGTAVEDGTLVTLRTSKGYFRESGQFWVEQMTLEGLVTGTLTSREIAGDVFITATTGSAVGTAQAYFLPDDPAYVEVWAIPAAIPADGRSHATVYVRIRDDFNNLVGPGITVTFTAARGHFVGDDNSCTTNTTLDGLASCVLVADTTPGTVIVIAETYNGVSGWFDLTFVEPHYIYVPIVRKRFAP
jgi:adhesin/invasin